MLLRFSLPKRLEVASAVKNAQNHHTIFVNAKEDDERR